MADDEPERPLLSEMAEKLRQARSSSFTDQPEAAPAPPPPSPVRAPGSAAAAGRPRARPPRTRFRCRLRIDSLERRLFELRAALEDAAAPRTAGSAGFGRGASDDAARGSRSPRPR